MLLTQSTQSWLLEAALVGRWLGLRISLSAFTKISWALNFQLNSHQKAHGRDFEQNLDLTEQCGCTSVIYLFFYFFIFSACSVWVFQLFQMWWKHLRGLTNCSRDSLDAQPGLISVQNHISPWVYKSRDNINIVSTKIRFFELPWEAEKGAPVLLL